MRFLSLFSGIEAASAAWCPLGWQCVGFSEIETFPRLLLAKRHSSVPNLGDVTKITEDQIRALGRIDTIVFGSPCQDLSIAGKRKGFTNVDGDFTRSGLFFAALRIIGWARKHCGLRFAVWENVPGAFSSNGGADFAAVVGNLVGLELAVPPKGWGTEGCAVGTEGMAEWSTLDAQWFGVAQRRRRVFVVADFGDWSGRPPILLESQGLRGDSAPSREAGQEVAGTLASRTDGGGFPGSDESCSGYVQPVAPTLRAGGNSTGGDRPPGTDVDTCDSLIAVGVQRPVLAFGGNNVSGPIDVATARNACSSSSGRLDFESETFVVQPNLIAFDSRQDCVSSEHVFGSLSSSSPQAQAVCHAIQAGALRTNPNSGPDGVGVQEGIAYTLEARAEVQAIHSGMAVRRLTPRECERLQGFPDDHTLIPVVSAPRKQKRNELPEKYAFYLANRKQRDAADGPRYKALGNSMAVPVMAWIGRQIDFAMLFDTTPARAGAEDLFA